MAVCLISVLVCGANRVMINTNLQVLMRSSIDVVVWCSLTNSEWRINAAVTPEVRVVFVLRRLCIACYVFTFESLRHKLLRFRTHFKILLITLKAL